MATRKRDIHLKKNFKARDELFKKIGMASSPLPAGPLRRSDSEASRQVTVRTTRSAA